MNIIDESIELYKSGMSILKVCEATGIGYGTLQPRLKKLGITRSNKENSRRYTVDHSFFDVINSELKAYWLGMLYADGHICHSKHGQKTVNLCCKESDSDHLASYLDALKADYPIGHYINKGFDDIETEYARVTITSDHLFDSLQLHGVVERKSLVLVFPTSVPAPLLHHFIRGYFDGDGSFSKSHDGYQFKVLGTKEFLNELSIHIGFPNRKLSQRKKNGKNNWTLDIGGRNQVIAIGDYMYNEATVFMERKHQRYLVLKEQ